MEVMKKEFVIDFISICSEYGYRPDNFNFVRDYKIQEEYKELRKTMSARRARQQLSELHCTGIKNIEYILYRKYRKLNNVG